MILHFIENDVPIDPNFIAQLRRTSNFPSRSTTFRLIRDNRQRFHNRTFVHAGNRQSTVLRGHDRVFIALCRGISPKAVTSEIHAFIRRMNKVNPLIIMCTSTQISETEKELGLNRKVSSTTAYQEFTSINLLRRDMHWNMPHPSSIADILREDFIDLDDAGIHEEDGSRKHVKYSI